MTMQRPRSAALALAAQGAAKVPLLPPTLMAPEIPDPAVDRETAAERLEAQRAECRKLIASPPSAHVAKREVLGWLSRVAELGHSGDVDLAWRKIENRTLKKDLRNDYDRLMVTAGRSYTVLAEAAAAERRAEREAAIKQGAADRLRRELAEHHAQAEAKLKKLSGFE